MFRYVRTIGGAGRKLVTMKLGVSQTFNVGEYVKSYTSGALDLGVAATPGQGIITAFVDGNGQPIKEAGIVAGVANASGVTSVTTDNTNSENLHAIIDIGDDSQYSADVNGTLGTTADSDLPGCKMDVDSANANYGRVLETTATRTVATTANFYCWGADPQDSSRVIVSLASVERNVDQNTEA